MDQARGFNNSHVNYFFNAINGYTAVRPRKMEDLYYNYIARGNMQVINMMNIKYVIQQNDQGQLDVQKNPSANGAAWFVKKLEFVEDHKAEFEALKTIDPKNTVLLREEYKKELGRYIPMRDSVSTISISKTDPDHLVYNAYSSNQSFVVFSETYYKNGWKALVDGKEQTIYPVNYMLRGLKLAPGKHTIEFIFEPKVVQTGSSITLASSVLLLLLLMGALFFEFKYGKK